MFNYYEDIAKELSNTIGFKVIVSTISDYYKIDVKCLDTYINPETEHEVVFIKQIKWSQYKEIKDYIFEQIKKQKPHWFL